MINPRYQERACGISLKEGIKKAWFNLVRNIRKTFADAFELPAEAVSALPVVTLTGQVEMIIENYGGVVEYSSEKITLATACGVLNIEGRELDIKYMNSQCVTVTGVICSFMFVE